jgi:CheY-like chemotaxis protein
MDGWEVLERLRADPVTRSVPVVVASIVEERAPGSALGVTEHLVKPVARDDLLRALHRVGALPDGVSGPASGAGR